MTSEGSNYVPPDYDPVISVENMQNAPRFSHTDHFYKLFSYDREEQVDYANGLIFITCLVFSFFLFWTILILVFKCMGPYQVGFLSGYHFVQPDPGTDMTVAKPYKRPFRVRITFVNCAIVVIIFAVLMVVNGFKNLQDTNESLNTATTDIRQLLDESDELAKTLFEIGDSSIDIRDRVVADLGNFCPGDPNIEQDTGIDFDEIAGETIDRLEELNNFIENDVQGLLDDLDRIKEAVNDVDDAVGYMDVEDWQVMMLAVPLVVLPAILLVGTVMAWMDVSFDWFQCAQTWFVLPLFVIVITFCWVFCSLFGVLGVTNSDFCSGGEYSGNSLASPDGTFLDILKVQEYDLDNLLYKALAFYVAQCKSEFPFQFISDYEEELIEGLNSVNQVLDSIEDVSVPRLNVLCDKDFAPLVEILQTMKRNLQVLDGSADLSLALLSCERINPIYVNTIHEATCTYSVTGVTWVFSSLLVISVAGMLMITFRASWLDAEYIQSNCYPVDERDMQYEAPTARGSKDDYTDDGEYQREVGVTQSYSQESETDYDEYDEQNSGHGGEEQPSNGGDNSRASDSGHENDPSPQSAAQAVSDTEVVMNSTRSWEQIGVSSENGVYVPPPADDMANDSVRSPHM